MLLHAYAPGKCPPPLLYAQYTWVQELGLTWEYLGGIESGEIGLLTEMFNIAQEAQRVKQAGQGKG